MTPPLVVAAVVTIIIALCLALCGIALVVSAARARTSRRSHHAD